MKKTLLIGMLASCVLSGCGTYSSSPGEEIVLIDKPFFVGEGGMRPEPLTKGRQWYWLSTLGIKYDSRPKRYDLELSNLIAKDNVPITMEVGVELQMFEGESPKLHSKFGPNYYKNNIELKFINLVRNYARTISSSDLTSLDTTSIQGQQIIKEELSEFLVSMDIPIKVNQVFINRATPPKEVLTEIANTASQRQRIKTEEQRRAAELARKQAEIAKAAADKAYKSEFGMTADQYLQLRGIEVQREMIDMVKDKDNAYIFMSSGGDKVQPMPTFNVKGNVKVQD
ncbi:SPFH domain-containing protein [Photobacterium damselae]|uniref:Band 7 domain-containing protein n=1 Tax=Photobacterium damselae subsp. damselae TaxID=85581 RepID=A0AAD3WUL8_PHODD|nr:SPFH domain-containing protein [Photobacterium damselae]KAB1179957.1 hypothetical protein F6450_12290 [Photobacterium damselae subsp. damselae]